MTETAASERKPIESMSGLELAVEAAQSRGWTDIDDSQREEDTDVGERTPVTGMRPDKAFYFHIPRPDIDAAALFDLMRYCRHRWGMCNLHQIQSDGVALPAEYGIKALPAYPGWVTAKGNTPDDICMAVLKAFVAATRAEGVG